jgi:RNA recognition motif-containing protein
MTMGIHVYMMIFKLNIRVVEYRYPEDAKRAIHTINKAEFMGRPVFVREVIRSFFIVERKRAY